MTVLNVEQKSIKSILKLFPFGLKLLSTVWRAVAVASSVTSPGNWYGSSGWKASLDVLLDQPLRTLEHLIDGVNWAGWEVSKLLTEDFCGRGIITAAFRQGGIVAAFRDRLKIFCEGFCEERTAFLYPKNSPKDFLILLPVFDFKHNLHQRYYITY